jgi:Flp pilus assembly pilin Flp
MRGDVALQNILRTPGRRTPWTPRGLASAARRLARDRTGATYVEYLMLLVFLGLGLVTAVQHLGRSVSGSAALVAEKVAALAPFEAPSLPFRTAPGELEPGAPIGPTGPGVLDPDSLDPRRPPSDFEAKVTTPNGLGYRVRIKSNQTTTLEPNGQNMVTLEISRTSNHTAKAELKSKSKHASGSVELFEGEGLSYRVKLPEAAYERIVRGEAPFPNPGDLSTLPDGSSVLLREEDLSATEQAGSYRIFKTASRQTDSQGSSVGLEVRGDRVRVLAGPTEAITDLTVLGVGAKFGGEDLRMGFEASFERTKSLRYEELDYADISRRQGQAAFEEFMRSGRVPQPHQVGVRQAGTVRKMDYDEVSAAKLALSVGDFDLTARLLNSSASVRNTDVVRPDGSHELTWILREHGVGVFESKTLAPDGRETVSQAGLLLDAVHPSYGRALGEAYDAQTEDKSYDLQLELTQAEYAALRNRAVDMLDGQSQYTDKQIAELRAGRDPGPSGNPVVDALVSHTDLDDFLIDVRLLNDGPNMVSEGLLRLYLGTSERGRLPGRMQFYDEHR